MKTSSPLPADPDVESRHDDARRFRRTMLTAVAICLTSGLVGAALTLALDGSASKAFQAGWRGTAVVASTLVLVHLFISDFRPALAQRWGLSRGICGDERERFISRDTTVRVYAATLTIIMLWSVMVTREMVAVYIAIGGILAEAVISQVRARRG